MIRTLPTTLIMSAVALAGLIAMARPGLSQIATPRGHDMTTGSVQSGPAPSSGLQYGTDGNSKSPQTVESTQVPEYQRGSGQETGGPAKELIPR